MAVRCRRPGDATEGVTMAEPADLVVENGTVVSGDATVPADLAIRDGVFVGIAAPGQLGVDAREHYDATGQHVLPGVIDGHVHFREPGWEYKEDFGTGSTAAVMGGVTTVLDMPNTSPPTDSPEHVDLKRKLAEAKSRCDVGLFGLVARDNVDRLETMARSGVIGYKCFLGETVGNIAAPDDGTLLDAMEAVQRTGLRVGFHAENDEILQHRIRRLKAEGRTDPLAHLDSRPALAEAEAIQRAALFAKHVGAKIHIFHLSSAEGLEAIGEWRARGVDITTEISAHHAFLTSDDMATLGARLRVNPPVREPGHGDALVAALADGRVDQIASDHAPHAAHEKLHDDIWQAISGFAGVEVGLRLFLTYGVHAGRMPLTRLAAATSEGPARTWGLWPRKGAIRVGSDGDLTIIDLERAGVIRADDLHGKSNLTPFDGHRTRGQAVATIVRGQLVMRGGELAGEPVGRIVTPTGEA